MRFAAKAGDRHSLQRGMDRTNKEMSYTLLIRLVNEKLFSPCRTQRRDTKKQSEKRPKTKQSKEASQLSSFPSPLTSPSFVSPAPRELHQLLRNPPSVIVSPYKTQLSLIAVVRDGLDTFFCGGSSERPRIMALVLLMFFFLEGLFFLTLVPTVCTP